MVHGLEAVFGGCIGLEGTVCHFRCTKLTVEFHLPHRALVLSGFKPGPVDLGIFAQADFGALGGGGHVGNDGTITAYQCAGDAVSKQHRFVDLVGAVKADTNKPVSLCGGPHSLVVVGDAVVDVGGLGRTRLVKPHTIPGNVAHG